MHGPKTVISPNFCSHLECLEQSPLSAQPPDEHPCLTQQASRFCLSNPIANIERWNAPESKRCGSYLTLVRHTKFRFQVLCGAARGRVLTSVTNRLPCP